MSLACAKCLKLSLGTSIVSFDKNMQYAFAKYASSIVLSMVGYQLCCITHCFKGAG